MWVQGVAVAALALTWLVLRGHRTSAPVSGGSGRMTRVVVGAALARRRPGAAALPVGTWAAGGADADGDRVVLRTYVEPPFDVGRYPSPLSAFRRYVEMPEPDAANLYDTELFTTEGAPVGTRVRIATLDHYDGVVWGASNDAFPGATDDTFRRVGSTIDNPAEGRALDVRVTLGEGYAGVWLPTIGALQSVDLGADAEAFRYNLDSGTGVVPSGLAPGDRYTFTAVVPADEVTAGSRPSEQLGAQADGTAFLDAPAAEWTEGLADPMGRVFAIADHLRTEGKYSDGVLAAERIYRPGHFLARLDKGFVNASLMVGNDEQYAAVMALLANKVGVPARVVLGAVVPDGGVVRGRDVQAWVELRVADGSWRVLPTEAFMDLDKPSEQQTRTERRLSGLVIPPPAQVPPPVDRRRADRRRDHGAQGASRRRRGRRGLRAPGLGARRARLRRRPAARPARRRRGDPGRQGAAAPAAAYLRGVLGPDRRRLARARRPRPRPRVGRARSPGSPGGSSRWRSPPAAAAGLARTADVRVFGPAEPPAGEAEQLLGRRRRRAARPLRLGLPPAPAPRGAEPADVLAAVRTVLARAGPVSRRLARRPSGPRPPRRARRFVRPRN